MKNILRELEEEIIAKTKRDIRREDIFYLLDHKVEAPLGNSMQTLKGEIAELSSFEELDHIFRFIIVKRPSFEEIMKKVNEFKDFAIRTRNKEE